MYFSCFSDSHVERYAIQLCWNWFRCKIPSSSVITTPTAPVTHIIRGKWKADRNGISAAAAISTTFIRLKYRWLLRLLRSYQAIWSSSRSDIESGSDIESDRDMFW